MNNIIEASKTDFSQADVDDLRLCEGKIVEGFRQVAIAFATIKDRRLYQIDGYSSFDDYCKARWQRDASTVYRTIEAARLCDSFEEIGTVSSHADSVTVPINEGQCRALEGSGTDQDKYDIWETVLASKDGDPDQVRQKDILDQVKNSALEIRAAIPVSSVVRIADPEHLINFDGCEGVLVSYKGIGTIANVDLHVSDGQTVKEVSIPSHYLELIQLPAPEPPLTIGWSPEEKIEIESPTASEALAPINTIQDKRIRSKSDALEEAIALIRLALTEGLDKARADMEKFLQNLPNQKT